MPHMNTIRSKPVTAVLLLVLASIVLGACGGSSGGSSSTSSTSANASATTPTTATAPRPNGGRFSALRECLQKNGITLAKRTPGQTRPPGGGFLGGGSGPKLPAGVTRAQYEAAFKKCGGSLAGPGAGRFTSPAFKAALVKFADCMRENGVNVPAPNTSGSGPIFNSSGLDTKSAAFKAAESKCSADLRNTFRVPAPAGGAGTATG